MNAPQGTPDEFMAVCIARQVQDGDLWTQGLNTPLVMAGLILAKLTHAPNMRFASAIGQGLTQDWAPLSLTKSEAMWLDKSVLHVGFAQAVSDVLPSLQPKEFFRPAQVDAVGNFNNVFIGRDYAHPRLRLPGAGGIPDVTPHYDRSWLYVPRHARAVFREKVDFISGLGHQPGRAGGPCYLISDLGQFDWHEGRMRLVSVHPHVDQETIERKTGFELITAPALSETTPPTTEDLHLLRDVIDPLNIRKLETLAGGARKDLLRQIIQTEQPLSD